MTQEIWKPVVGYEGLYEISNLGRIFSVKKSIMMRFYDHHGYSRLKLTKAGKETDFAVHRLVADAFIPNPQNLPFINHKDYNRSNNAVENLEWCTAWYNSNYSLSKPVAQYTKCGKLVAIYLSAKLAAKHTGIDDSTIGCVVTGIRGRTGGGFVWKFADDADKVSVNNPVYFTGLPYKAIRTDTRKRVCQYTMDWVFIKEYESSYLAAKMVGCSQGSISSVCTGYQKSAGGYRWKYADTV